MGMQQQQARPHKSVSWRTVALIAAVVLATIFAVENWTQVYVWPLGGTKPLIVVIGISFALGGLIGWLAHSILFGRRAIAPDHSIMDSRERDER